MRHLALAALVLAGCSGKKEHENVRFMVHLDVKLVGEVDVSIGGKPIEFEDVPPTVSTTYGFVDFKSAEMKVDTAPQIKLRTHCGERVLQPSEYERRGPNESNVVEFRLVESLFPKPSVRAAIDPAARDVKIGTYAVPAGARTVSLWGDCPVTVSAGGETMQMPPSTSPQNWLLVAESAATCLNEGVVVYATPGASCEREWGEKRTGQLAYWSKVFPTIIFEPIHGSETTTHKEACVVRGYIARC